MNFAVIGHPIAHSFSPFLHEVNFKENNDSHAYIALDIEPQNLKNIRQIIKEHNLSGFNVTVPHKEQIISYLDEVHSSAAQVGAVNTVLVNGEQLIGYNTDVSGYKHSFINSFTETDKKVLILGAGGASKAVLAAHLQMNHTVTIVARNPKSFNGFKNKDFKKLLINEGYSETYDVVVNATPLGLKHEDAFKYFNLEDAVHEGTIGMDLIYNPATTEFMKHFKIFKNGLDMLIYQAMDAYEIWTEKRGNREAVKIAFIERELPNGSNR